MELQDEKELTQLNSMDLKGGSNGLKVAFPNVENTNPTSQTMERGVLRDEIGTMQEGCKEKCSQRKIRFLSRKKCSEKVLRI